MTRIWHSPDERYQALWVIELLLSSPSLQMQTDILAYGAESTNRSLGASNHFNSIIGCEYGNSRTNCCEAQ